LLKGKLFKKEIGSEIGVEQARRRTAALWEANGVVMASVVFLTCRLSQPQRSGIKWLPIRQPAV